MNNFLKVLFLLLSVNTTALHAVSFTADAVQIRGENISHAKMYWLDGNVRFEYTEDGVPMAQIFDNKNDKVIWLDNENKFYLEKDMPDSEKVVAGSGAYKKGNKTIDPCKQFADAECVFLKRTKMNGRDADKWLITLNNNGNDFHIFQWIDVQYKNILRQENSDGSGLSVEIKDDQNINARKVRKLTLIAFSATGNQKKAIQWYDNELNIVVKQEYQSDVVDELRNIKIGKVGKKLFSIPGDYALFDTALEAAIETSTDQSPLQEQIVYKGQVLDAQAANE